MNVLTHEELKVKIDRGDDFKLVMVLNDWAFNAKHIPGSINVTSPQQALEELDPSEEIVVYCSDENCVASVYAYGALERAGYTNIHRFAGGITDWEAAGYPLEGEQVTGSAA